MIHIYTNNMTKQELIKAIADTKEVNRHDVEAAVEGFIEVVKKELVEGGEVTLRGFGTFRPKFRAAKIARNIKAGEMVNVSERYVPAFKPAQEFKEELLKLKK